MRDVLRYSALCLLLLIASTCGRRQYLVDRQSTGTCEGACDYYLSCKGSEDQQRYHACHTECSDFFSDQQALRELERLTCDELVSFIDGPNGREPGQH